MITEPNSLLKKYKCCVIIPTYNNAKTLARVINGVLNYTDNIIIINDGCTDNTREILNDFSTLTIIHLETNQGKGNALCLGLQKAEELGFSYAISIDSDGQHYFDDIPLFINELEKSENKKLLLIGERNLSADGMPKKNTFANKFSNFWYWAETGKKLSDTQSGFRLYPVKDVNSINLFTTKYEFEIEVIVKASWKGIEVRNIPIRVLYDEEERVSHFRPFKDFFRISLLNTWLVFVALVWIKPRDFFRRLKKKGFKKFFYEDFLGSNDAPLKKAFSVGLGTFIGISPFWGFQTFLSIFLAQIFRLNKTISFAFSNVSIPPMIPFIVYGSLKVGSFLLNRPFNLNLSQISTYFDIKQHLEYLLQYIIGSFVLASFSALLLGAMSYGILTLIQKKK